MQQKNKRKLSYAVVTFILSSILVIACSEDEPSVSIVEKQKTLLAGKTNESKKWKLVSGVAISSGVTPTESVLSYNSCFLDNEYIFFNNANQTYDNTEGNTKCAGLAPTVIESGFWAFSENGEKLLISANDLFNLDESLFGKFGSPPASVITLTDDQLIIAYNYTQTGVDNGRFKFTFESI
jgi:hypothetical protein